MMVLFAVSFVCLFHLVCMVPCLLIIYSSLKICIQILKKCQGVGVAVRYCEPHRMSHLEEASLHPGLYKRLRAVVAREF